jgi:hypothetical protein
MLFGSISNSVVNALKPLTLSFSPKGRGEGEGAVFMVIKEKNNSYILFKNLEVIGWKR